MTTLLLAAALRLSLSPPVAAGWCSSRFTGDWAVSHLVKIVSARSAEADESRQMYGLPAVPAASVVLVNDEATCERAARAYYRYRLGPMPSGGVAVVHVGNRYAVYGAIRAGEWTVMSIYSESFEPIINIAM